MSMIPWNKSGLAARRDVRAGLGPQDDFHREMDRVFQRFFEQPWAGLPTLMTTAADFAPPLDVAETDKEVTVKAELPGVDPSQIEIKVMGDTLTLSGKKEESREEKGENFHRTERTFGSFMRRVPLPEAVDPDKVNAEFKSGVLTVRMPKKPGAAPKKIPVVSK